MLKRLICLTLILSLLAEQCLAQGVPAADISSGLTVRSFRPPQLCSISFPPGQGQIDFIIDKGDEKTLKEDGVRALAPVLLNYFYTGLSLPDDSLWVNLRPDSDKSIIDPSLEKTDAGRILLEADVQLKKDLAMLTSPQKPEGRQYWTLLYAKAAQLFGASRQEIPTLARPWIVPGEIVLKESPTGVYVYKAVLRVKLEQDRLKDSPTYNFDDPRLKQLNDYAAVLLRQLIIPRLTRQVNSDRSYAALRQVYYSLVLAQWLKKRALAAPGTVPAPIKTRIDSGDLTGLTSRTPWAKEEYYTAYRKSFEKSEYSFSETTNSGSEVSIRTYNSGGIMIAPESDTRFIVTQGKELPSTRNSSRIRTALDGGDPETEKEPARTDEDLPSYISRQDNSQSTGFTAVSYQDIRNLADMIDWETALAKIDQYKYFFVFPIKNPENLLYITGNFDLNSLERDSSLRMRLELRKILERSMQKELGPADNGLVLELLKQVQSSLGGPEGISEPQLLFILLRNTQRNFDAWIKSYGLGTPYIPEENRIGSEDYSHTRLFAYIYYQEIRELHRLLDAEPDKTISVLDLGTGMANVLFSIMQSLTPEERKRVKLFGIDGQERDMNIARKYGKERGYDITFRKVNVERPDWMQQTLLLNGGEKFDLVISNHVLEHLDPANPPDKYVREWLTLGKNLVVSVPMDEPEETFKLSGHQFRFDVGRLDLIGGILRNDGLNVNLQETSKGIFIVNTPKTDGGTAAVLGSRFGKETVSRIRDVYGKTWGNDKLRLKGQPEHGMRIDQEKILSTLNDMYALGGVFQDIARNLSEALMYSQGMIDEKGYMKPVQPEQLTQIAMLWQEVNKKFWAASYGVPKEFGDLWVEYNVFLTLRKWAEALTGKSGTDSYSGTSLDNGLAGFSQYEMADLVALRAVNHIMRISPDTIGNMIEAGEFARLASLAAAARLHGEGRFLTNLSVYLNRLPPALREEFEKTVDIYVKNIEKGYRQGTPLAEVNAEDVITQTQRLQEAGGKGIKLTGFDFDREILIKRQRDLRPAEEYLQKLESEYSAFSQKQSPQTAKVNPAQLYKEAVDSFLDYLELVYAGTAGIDEGLNRFHARLLAARKAADDLYGNDYYWWTGYGESLNQMKVRAKNPREKLYSIEAYAERLCFAATTVDSQGPVTKESFNKAFGSVPSYFLQEWINYFGPRRQHIFGQSSLSNAKVIEPLKETDRDVREIVRRARDLGGREELWGWMYCGLTEKLRYMFSKKLITFNEAAAVLDKEGVEGFERRILEVREIDKDANAVIGMHVHNASIDTLTETLSHASEIGWNPGRKWVILGTDTNNMKIAEQERALAIELGLTRYAVGARRHLKAGNQNRIMPNVPLSETGETFYLTLDDDYAPASGILYRVIPLMMSQNELPYIQIPLYFRANSEMGYTRSKRLDSSIVYSYSLLSSGLVDTKYDRASGGSKNDDIVVPCGTGTVFRLTPGNNQLEEIGYFPVGTSAEDTAVGMMLFLKNNLDIYADPIKSSGKRQGVYLNEMWVRGDGVEYEGRLRQQIRWSEGGSRVFLMMIGAALHSIFKTGGIGRIKPFTLLKASLTYSCYIQLALMSAMFFVGIPVFIIMFGLGMPVGFFASCAFTLSSLIFLLQWFILKDTGLGLREWFEAGALQFYGASLSIFRGITNLFLPPSAVWFSNKTGVTSYLTWNNIGYGLMSGLNVVAIGSILSGYSAKVLLGFFPELFLFNAGLFLYMYTLQQQPPKNDRERIALMYNQFVKESPQKRLPAARTFKAGIDINKNTFLYGLTLLAGATSIGLAVTAVLTGVSALTFVVLSMAMVTVFVNVFYISGYYTTMRRIYDFQSGKISKDGGTPGGKTVSADEPGGVDLSGAMKNARPANDKEIKEGVADPVLLRAPLTDLDREWSRIRVKLLQGVFPIDELKRYIDTCYSRPGCAGRVKDVSDYIVFMLKTEEQNAVETPAGMQAVLGCFK